MTAHYWGRQARLGRDERPVFLHFTHHPGDLIIRVALRNRPAHDIIVVPENSSPTDLYRLVRDYTKALTKTELRQLSTASSTYPQPMDVHQKVSTS